MENLDSVGACVNKEQSKCLAVMGENSSLYLLSPGSRIRPAVRSLFGVQPALE